MKPYWARYIGCVIVQIALGNSRLNSIGFRYQMRGKYLQTNKPALQSFTTTQARDVTSSCGHSVVGLTPPREKFHENYNGWLAFQLYFPSQYSFEYNF
jgi:hypothetical protein